MKINLFNNFTTAKKARKPRNNTIKEIGRVCEAVAKLDENNNFVAAISLPDGDIEIPFTLESYDCTNKNYIFLKSTCKQRKCTCIIRDNNKAKVAHSNEHYTAIALNWIYTGKITEINGKTYFNAHNAVTKQITIVHDRF